MRDWELRLPTRPWFVDAVPLALASSRVLPADGVFAGRKTRAAAEGRCSGSRSRDAVLRQPTENRAGTADLALLRRGERENRADRSAAAGIVSGAVPLH